MISEGFYLGLYFSGAYESDGGIRKWTRPLLKDNTCGGYQKKIICEFKNRTVKSKA